MGGASGVAGGGEPSPCALALALPPQLPPAQNDRSERSVVTSRGPFLIFTPPKIFLERLTLETSNFVQWLVTWSINHLTFGMTNSASSGRGHGHVTSVNFGK